MELSVLASPRQEESTSTLRNVWHYRGLLANLVTRELTLQYRGAFLGVLWSLLNPVLLVIVYMIAFEFVLRFGLANYALWLVTGILHWQFFALATITSTTTLINNANLIHNIPFPRIILPLSVVGSKLLNLLLFMIAYVVFFVPMGGVLWWGLLVYPFILGLQIIFVTGITLGISILTLYFRDLRHLLEVGIPMLFWLTPIIYNFDQVPEWAHTWFRFNPMTSFITSYQDIFYLNQLPSFANWAFMIFMAFSALGLGYALFERMKPDMEDYL